MDWLNKWVEKHPHVTQSQIISDSIIFTFNVILFKKQKQLLQISVRDLYNDIILPVSQGKFHAASNEDSIVRIGCTSLRNYTPKHKKTNEQ